MPNDETNSCFVSIERYRGVDMFNQLKKLSARTKYYFEQHKLRWERRYEMPYPDCDGEFGTFDDVRWLHA